MGIATDLVDIDVIWMRRAITLAQKAESEGEIPVGAILVKDNKSVATGWNQSIQLHDPSAHAEIVAIRKAGQQLQNYRLVNTTLYVTLEPCVMCMGAIAHGRIQRLVFGAYDPKRGAVCSAMQLAQHPNLNHHITWSGGVLVAETASLLQQFFRAKRLSK